MNIIDSSLWLEYFADTKAGDVSFNCTLWTQDKHFMELESVNYLEKQK